MVEFTYWCWLVEGLCLLFGPCMSTGLVRYGSTLFPFAIRVVSMCWCIEMTGPCVPACLVRYASTLFPFAIRVVSMWRCIEMNCCLVANGYDNPLCRIVPTLLSLYHRVVSRCIAVFLLSPGVYRDVFLLPGYAYTQVSPLFEGKKFLTWNFCTFVCNIVVKLQTVQ